MQSFGDIWYGAAPAGVVAGLGGDDVRNYTSPDCDGGTSVVEAGFNG